MAIIPYQIPPIYQPPPLHGIVRGIDSCPAGPYLPTQVVNVAVGDVAWSNPDNARVSDDVYATAILVAQTTQQLQASGFNCQIDPAKQINGILVEVEGKESVGSSAVLCRIIKGGAVSATSRSNTWTTTEQFLSYGGSTDLWGETWTPADINLANFGVCVRLESGLTATLSCDSVRITIYCAVPTLQSLPWQLQGQMGVMVAQ